MRYSKVFTCVAIAMCALLVSTETFAVKKRCFRSTERNFTIIQYKDDIRKKFHVVAYPALDTEGFFLLLTIMELKNDGKNQFFNLIITKFKAGDYTTDLLTPGALNNWLLSCQSVHTADFTHIFGDFPIDPSEVIKF